MGNGLCCSSLCSSLVSYHNCGWESGLRIIDAAGGEIMEFREALKVAEVMLENPDNFVCPLSVLEHAGKWAIPLRADEELKPPQVYVLLPMYKLYSRLTPEEVAFLLSLLEQFQSRNRKLFASLKTSSKQKITPLCLEFHPRSKSTKSDVPATTLQDSDALEKKKKKLQQPELSTPQVTNCLANPKMLQFAAMRSQPYLTLSDYVAELGSMNSTRPFVMTRSRSWLPKLETIREVMPNGEKEEEKIHCNQVTQLDKCRSCPAPPSLSYNWVYNRLAMF